MATVTITIEDAAALGHDEREAIIALCAAAFAEPFDQLFALLPGSRHILLRVGQELVSHACWVTRWLQPAGIAPLQTAYIEAVATAPRWQGQGYGTLVMQEVAQQTGNYELCALSPAVAPFYERLGWQHWRGPTAIRTDTGLLPTPDEEIMIMRTPQTPPLDLTAQITAEWREGELW